MLENVNEVVEGLGNKVVLGDSEHKFVARPEVKEIYLNLGDKSVEISSEEMVAMELIRDLAESIIYNLCEADNSNGSVFVAGQTAIQTLFGTTEIRVKTEPKNDRKEYHVNPLTGETYKDQLASRNGLQLYFEVVTGDTKQIDLIPLNVYGYSKYSNTVTVLDEKNSEPQPSYRMTRKEVRRLMKQRSFTEVTIGNQIKHVMDKPTLVNLIWKHFIALKSDE